MIETDKIYNMDCLEGMSRMPEGSVDAIIADLPYGVLNRGNRSACWDRQIPLGPLWEQYRRIIKPDSPIILFAQGIFSAHLMLSQPGIWRYNLVWQKDRVTGHLNANRMPLRQHEDILVFYMKQPVYHPQMTPCPPERRNHGRSMTEGSFTNRCYGEMKLVPVRMADNKYPTSVIFIPKEDRGILSSDPEACGTGRVPDTHLHRRGGHRAGQLHRVRNDCHCRNPFGTALYRIRDREGVLRHRRTPYPGRTGANTYDDIRVKEKQMEYKQSTT